MNTFIKSTLLSIHDLYDLFLIVFLGKLKIILEADVRKFNIILKCPDTTMAFIDIVSWLLTFAVCSLQC